MIVKTLLIDRLHNTAAGGVQVPVPAQHEGQPGHATAAGNAGISHTFLHLYDIVLIQTVSELESVSVVKV